jgi:hypothetical protein
VVRLLAFAGSATERHAWMASPRLMVLLHAAFLLLALHADAGTDSEDFRRLSEHVRVLGVTLNQDTFSDRKSVV